MLKRLVARLGTDPTVRTERIKLLAGGTQLIAIGIIVGSIVGPFLNPALPVAPGERLIATTLVAALEPLALKLLGYLVSPAKEG